jgi:glycerol-3-phosphate dehydrogenase
LVVESRDINAGASGANHGLLHSGARYAAVDPEAARECAAESRLLKLLAPHCIEDTGGLFVAFAGDDENYVADFPSHCEKSGIEAQRLDHEDALEMEPELSDTLIAAYRVNDASVNPFKLSIDNMAHAMTLGGRFLSHTSVVGFEREGSRITAVRLRREPEGTEFVVSPQQIINASGAWVGEVAALADIPLEVVCSKGSLLITQTRLTDRVINRLRYPSDGDIVAPGGTVSLLGTTSIRMEKPRYVHATFPEVDFLVAESARMLPILTQTRFIRAFAGVRSLPADGKEADDRALHRSFVVMDHEQDGVDNFISLFGGKLTTFRLMAEKTADVVCKRLGVSAECLTRKLPLPSCEIGKWIEPLAELRSWFKSHNPDDTLLCECEMAPVSVANRIMDDLRSSGANLDFNAISLRSRVGKGSCQGAYCAFRLCCLLYQSGAIKDEEGVRQLKAFLEQRWAGLRPVLWGRQLVQEQLQEAIQCGLFGLELQ